MYNIGVQIRGEYKKKDMVFLIAYIITMVFMGLVFYILYQVI